MCVSGFEYDYCCNNFLSYLSYIDFLACEFIVLDIVLKGTLFVDFLSFSINVNGVL